MGNLLINTRAKKDWPPLQAHIAYVQSYPKAISWIFEGICDNRVIAHAPRFSEMIVGAPCSFFTMISCFLLVMGSLAYTIAASFPSRINFAGNTTLSNLTFTDPRAQSNDSVAESNFNIWYCSKTERWSLPALEPADCSGVLDYFYIETVDATHRKSREFRAPGAKKSTHLQTQWTPRKYTFGMACLPTMFLLSEVLLRLCPTAKRSRSHVSKSQSPKSQPVSLPSFLN